MSYWHVVVLPQIITSHCRTRHECLHFILIKSFIKKLARFSIVVELVKIKNSEAAIIDKSKAGKPVATCNGYMFFVKLLF